MKEKKMRRQWGLSVLALSSFVLAVTTNTLAGDSPFTTIDFPGAIFTETDDINARGDVVGRYLLSPGGTSHGYLLSRGRFMTIDFPGAVFTSPKGINPHGDLVGVYTDPDGRNHGFLLSRGIFTTFDVPGDTDTFNVGINPRGDIVGVYCDRPCKIISVDLEDRLPSHGYLLKKDGELIVFDFPGAISTGAFRINPRGDIVGTYWDTNGQPHGYVLSEGQFTSIDFPGAIGTHGLGINADGDIVGSYCAVVIFRPKCTFRGNDNHAYLLSDGTFTPLDFPDGTLSSRAWGINPRGDIAGSYRDSQFHAHGFVLSTGERDEDADSE